MNRIRKTCLLLCLPVLSACGAATGNYFAPTAAVVCAPDIGCHKIAEAQISEILTGVMKNPTTVREFRGPQGPANRLDAKREVLTGLIRQTIAREQGRRMGIEVTPREVEAQLKRIRGRFPNQAAFQQSLAQQGFSVNDVRIYLRNQLLFQELGPQLLRGQKPGDQELMDYYSQNKATLYDSQVRVAHILICGQPDPRTRLCNPTEADQALAVQVANRARAAEDFAALAKQFSKDASNADKGGDLGYVTPGTLAAEFEQAAFAMTAPGQISDPVKTVYGIHVIKLIAKGKSFEEARPEITQTLSAEAQNKTLDAWMRGGVAAAKVRVNPAIGRFDPSSQRVVPLKAQPPAAGIRAPSGQAGQGGAQQPSSGEGARQQAPAPPAQPPAAPERPQAPQPPPAPAP